MAKSRVDYWLTQDGLILIQGWARDGLLEKQIAKNMGVSLSTFSNYKKKHVEILNALKKHKEIVDYEVENSLYQRCVGTYAEEDRAFKCKEVYYDEDGRRCEREVVRTIKVNVFVPPDTTAIAIWLNNRRSDKWRRNAGKEKLDEKKFEHDKDIDNKKNW